LVRPLRYEDLGVFETAAVTKIIGALVLFIPQFVARNIGRGLNGISALASGECFDFEPEDGQRRLRQAALEMRSDALVYWGAAMSRESALFIEICMRNCTF
jgi:hypothetical protein